MISPMADRVLVGKLLVASPRLSDGTFDRSVVLLIDHSAGGAVGVVINRPSTTLVEDALPQWGDRAAEPPVVFIGGPVSPTAAICLGGWETTPSEGWRPLFDGLGTLDLERSRHDIVADVDWLRVFAGYAGWGAGQLEDEIASGAWFVVPVAPTDVLSPDPEQLWRAVLRRQRGAVAAVANFPADLSVN